MRYIKLIVIKIELIISQLEIGRFITVVVVYAIKLCFFVRVDHYFLSRKLHTSRFLSLFYGKMIRAISARITIAIEDFKQHCKNKNLSIKKSKICFKPYIQNKSINEYILLFTIFKFFYTTLIVIIVNKSVCLS